VGEGAAAAQSARFLESWLSAGLLVPWRRETGSDRGSVVLEHGLREGSQLCGTDPAT
jgi:hypothetical protein